MRNKILPLIIVLCAVALQICAAKTHQLHHTHKNLRHSVANSTDENPPAIQSINGTGTNSTNSTVITSADDSTSGSGHGFIIFLIIVVILGASLYAFWRHRTRHITQQLSMDPEQLIPRQVLTQKQQQSLQALKFNPSPQEREAALALEAQKHKKAPNTVNNDFPPYNPNVTVEEIKDDFGQVMRLIFKHNGQGTSSITSNLSVPKSERERDKVNDIAYFEVEVEQIDALNEFSIGYCSKNEFSPSLDLGNSGNSIAFNSRGLLRKQNNTLYNFATDSDDSNLNANQSKIDLNQKQFLGYGECIGIALKQSDGSIFVSKNGELLNEPPPPPPPSTSSKKDSANEKNAKKDQPPEEELTEEKMRALKLKEDKQKKRQFKMDLKAAKDAYPVICVNGPCRLLLNVGGKTFRLYQKEIDKGLINRGN